MLGFLGPVYENVTELLIVFTFDNLRHHHHRVHKRNNMVSEIHTRIVVLNPGHVYRQDRNLNSIVLHFVISNTSQKTADCLAQAHRQDLKR